MEMTEANDGDVQLVSGGDGGTTRGSHECGKALLHNHQQTQLKTDNDIEEGNNDSDTKTTMDANKEAPDIEFVIEKPRPFVYKVSENPPLHWAILFGLQQGMVSIANPLTTTLVVSEVACLQEDSALKVQILSSTLFMVGLATFTMCTFGCRLPIFQGPSIAYLIPLLALKGFEGWTCPESTFNAVDPVTNVTTLMANMGNGTIVPYREQALNKIGLMSGSLCVAGALHFLIGISGAVGIIIRFIGPITIVPTIILVGLQLYKVVAKFCEADWMTAVLFVVMNLVLSFYLGKRKTPIPMWNSQRGFYIHWYPLHKVLSIFFTMVTLYILATILTHTGVYTDDPKSKHYMARTDARSSVVAESEWFRFPYPGQFGSFAFNAAIFGNFLVATVISILDSIGDYPACARVAKVTPPPPFAFNRGLAVEGLMSTLSGLMGCCHATISFGMNIGAMNLTRVVSRRVFQTCGLIFIFFGIFTKFGAMVITVPYPLIGGMLVVSLGMFIGVLLSALQNVDLNSNRNLGIVGSTLLLGFVVPYWLQNNPDGISTGNKDFDGVIKMLMQNPPFIGGVYACLLDNTMPGTRSERGLASQEKELHGETTMSKDYEDGPEVYRLPFLPLSFRKSPFIKYIPLFDTKTS